MKTTVRQNEFSYALSIASRFVSTRAQLPILSNIAIKASKTNMTIMATNLEISISTQIGAKTSEEGEIAIPSRVIVDLVNNIKNETIELSAEKENLEIKTDDLTGNIVGLNLSDFPSIPQALGKKSISLVYDDFIDCLNRVMFAVSRDETRSNLTGVLLSFDTSGVTLVASDGFRLSYDKMNLKHNLEEKIIVPKNILLELTRLGDKQTEKEIKMEVDSENSQIVFAVGGSIISSRLIEGNFPDFEKIVPKSFKTLVNVDRVELLDAIKLASVIARDSANVVKLVVGEQRIVIETESARSGSQKVQMPAKIEGDSLEISYNYRFVEELLNILGGGEVNIEFNQSNSPGVFKTSKHKDFFHLIMPVKS